MMTEKEYKEWLDEEVAKLNRGAAKVKVIAFSLLLAAVVIGVGCFL